MLSCKVHGKLIHRRDGAGVTRVSGREGDAVPGTPLSGLSAPLPDPIDYGELRGLPKSFGKEAGDDLFLG